MNKNDAISANSQLLTEQDIRANGGVVIMGAYQVFNPFTGIHSRYETKAEAKAALLEITKQIVTTYTPSVCRELMNENGDTTWVADSLNSELQVTFKG